MMLSFIFLPVSAESAGVAGGSGGGSGGASQVAYAQSLPMPIPTLTVPGDGSSANFSKLYISPQYLQFRMKPGEKQALTFSVTNRGTGSVEIKPNLVSMSYGGPGMIESAWVTVSPVSATLMAGDKAKFTVSVSVPADTVRGYYSGQLALTDEQFPAMYPMPTPNYVHTLSISTEVTGLPAISVSPYMLGDTLQAGNNYDYDITLKNNANHAIAINPKITSQMYMVPMPYGGSGGQTLTDDAFTVTAPGEVPASGEATLHVHIDVPPDASGYYNGMIDLGADDPSIQNGEGAIQLNFMVWKQPDVPFVKSFDLKTDEPITIELTASRDTYGPVPVSAGTTGKPMADPSFDLSIMGPGGKVTPVPVKTVIKGSVSLSQNAVPYAATGSDEYQDSGAQYVSTYSIDGKAGQWTLSVMPHNLSRFDYSITMGSDGELTVAKATATKNQTPVMTPMVNGTQNATATGFANTSGTSNTTVNLSGMPKQT